MVVARVTWNLDLPGCSSLKEKRSVVKSLKDRLRHRFNVSVAETRYQDVRTRAQITAVLVATDGRFADSSLEKLDRFVCEHARAVVAFTDRELY